MPILGSEGGLPILHVGDLADVLVERDSDTGLAEFSDGEEVAVEAGNEKDVGQG